MAIVIICMIIVLYSVVQSLFGVGLLVFGTPTLMLMGFTLNNALLHLLPASISISFLQLVSGQKHINKNSKRIPLYIIPTLVAGLALILYFDKVYNAKLPVALLLIFASIIRLSPQVKSFLQSFLKSNQRIFLSIIGLIHGTTNMGGSLLTVYCSSLYDNKTTVRTHIALGYFFMGIFQILILFMLKQPELPKGFWFFPVISISTYFLTNKLAFNKMSENFYQKLLSVSMGLFGLALLMQI